MFTKLFTSIELLSNNKSFKLFVGSTRDHLWLLIHFKHLEIAHYKLQYQINNGMRQREKTIHPKRWMKKPFKNTAELLEYLSSKSYDIRYMNFEFNNGWKIKETPQIEFIFYTNSLQQRNNLIDNLLGIAGLELKDKSVLTPNITYMLKVTGEVYPLDDELTPDEFWTVEQRNAWRLEYQKKHSSENENEFPEIPDVPFDENTKSVNFHHNSLLNESVDQSNPF
jgi:hypothetical protein